MIVMETLGVYGNHFSDMKILVNEGEVLSLFKSIVND